MQSDYTNNKLFLKISIIFQNTDIYDIIYTHMSTGDGKHISIPHMWVFIVNMLLFLDSDVKNTEEISVQKSLPHRP